jgi:FlaA1/EpsC-like NDP-sugar epimerase
MKLIAVIATRRNLTYVLVESVFRTFFCTTAMIMMVMMMMMITISTTIITKRLSHNNSNNINNNNYRTFITGNTSNITFAIYCNHRKAARLHIVETYFVPGV